MRRRTRSLIAACTAAALLTASPSLVSWSHADPANPSDTQIHAAQAAKDQTAALVGQLSAQVAQQENELRISQAKAELAEQKYAFALSKLQMAKVKAAAAKASVAKAAKAVAKAEALFRQFVLAQYQAGPDTGAGGTVLTADDPNAALQRGDLQAYASARKVSAIGALTRARVAKSNADAAARNAVAEQTAATDAAEQAKAEAQERVREQEQLKAQKAAALAATQTRLEAARAHLADLNNQRATYNAWKAEQERLAREKAERERKAREAAAAAAAAAAARARQIAAASNDVPVAATSGGHWTAEAGQTAVNRAMQYLGIAYSFAAGSYSGPTYGVAVDFDSRNDGGILGFDCSGLTMYAWAPYIHLDHFAATQYGQAGNTHPSTGSLMPGDLVFWSYDGTEGGIHHVAMYVGNGNVIQAPFSGSHVQITPLGDVSPGYYGATRPLT